MEDSGLPPGSRAYHVLLFAYVRAKMANEALEVAKRASKAGASHKPDPPPLGPSPSQALTLLFLCCGCASALHLISW
jgi:hypothetical protein